MRLNMLHIGGCFLGYFVSVLQGQMHFDHAFFFSCQNWAILWSYFGFVEPAVYQHEEPGVLALLHDWHWENQSHDYCQGKTPDGLACRPETSMTWCLLSQADPAVSCTNVCSTKLSSFSGSTKPQAFLLLGWRKTLTYGSCKFIKGETDKQED